ncbi:unnamed protein product [Cuscuta campestris]|uniref:Uncharacterized protein n=1 Tax=Cuscuta campestris TaxID=132261 RepID=A0A484M9W3_9ASTE|nr:unnamed protein product [Cuscuta campestris]
MNTENPRIEGRENQNLDASGTEEGEGESDDIGSDSNPLPNVGWVIADSEYEESKLEDEPMQGFGSEFDEDQFVEEEEDRNELSDAEMGSHSNAIGTGVGVVQRFPGLLSYRDYKILLSVWERRKSSVRRRAEQRCEAEQR